MNPQRAKRAKNINPESQSRASEMLHAATNDLKALMDKVKQMSEADLKLNDVLNVLEGIGRAATRLANLLKAEEELAGGSDLGSEVDEAIAELFGNLARVHPEGYDGVGGIAKPPSE